jgi:hypothetical protein
MKIIIETKKKSPKDGRLKRMSEILNKKVKVMEAKIKAKELVDKFSNLEYPTPTWSNNKETSCYSYDMAKQCAIIAVENEYHALRELIFLLRSNGVIESEKTFLHFVDLYIKEEAEVKREIELL